jgi:hypothetical protein
VSNPENPETLASHPESNQEAYSVFARIKPE